MLETLADLFVTHGVPVHVRSDNGPAFTAELVRLWLHGLQVQTWFIEPGSPWENGSVESFTGTLRDELLDRELFYTLTEAKILIERCAASTTPSDRTAHWILVLPRQKP